MFRLDRMERYALAKTFPNIPPEASSWLFGSRTNMNARGGDIDILIQIDLSEKQRFELSQKLTLCFQDHCDEKIDFVVYPKTNLNAAETAFFQSLTKLPLQDVIHAPRLDHIAILVRNLDDSRETAAKWGFPLQTTGFCEGVGTTETYIGEPSRSARVLLREASTSGPYRRALEKRGSGLHHLGVCVPSLDYFLANLQGSGWLIHPKSVSAIRNGDTVWKLSRLNIPELSWEPIQETAMFINGEWVSLKRVSDSSL